MSTLAFIPNIGPVEWVIILVIMLILFGRRLPEVGKSIGKGIVEFRKGIKGIEDEIEDGSSKSYSPPHLTEGGTDPRVSRSSETVEEKRRESGGEAPNPG
jgi:sec-independent protein translocase protein TatA